MRAEAGEVGRGQNTPGAWKPPLNLALRNRGRHCRTPNEKAME